MNFQGLAWIAPGKGTGRALGLAPSHVSALPGDDPSCKQRFWALWISTCCSGGCCPIGLWEGYRWPPGETTRSFCIITTGPNALMVPIHDRIPVVLETADWPVWLGEADGDPAALLRPAADGVLRAWPISTRVNSPRNNTPDLLDELEPPLAD